MRGPRRYRQLPVVMVRLVVATRPWSLLEIRGFRRIKARRQQRRLLAFTSVRRMACSGQLRRKPIAEKAGGLSEARCRRSCRESEAGDAQVKDDTAIVEMGFIMLIAVMPLQER